jgi:hypothetical protein
MSVNKHKSTEYYIRILKNYDNNMIQLGTGRHQEGRKQLEKILLSERD